MLLSPASSGLKLILLALDESVVSLYPFKFLCTYYTVQHVQNQWPKLKIVKSSLPANNVLVSIAMCNVFPQANLLN